MKKENNVEFHKEVKMPLYVADYRDNTFEKGLKIIIIEEGTGILKIDDEKKLFSGSNIFCLESQEEYKFEKVSDLKAKLIIFHPQLINDRFDFEKVRDAFNIEMTFMERQDMYCLKPFVRTGGIKLSKIELGPLMLKKVQYLIEGMQKELMLKDNAYWPCRSRSFLLELVLFISKLYHETQLDKDILDMKKLSDEAEEIVLYLHTNYSNKITIKNLSEEFGINRTSLNQMFIESLGDSVISYLRKIRLRVATILLKDTYIPIGEVVERSGFNDIANFNRTFKKYIGETPGEYRKNNIQF